MWGPSINMPTVSLENYSLNSVKESVCSDKGLVLERAEQVIGLGVLFFYSNLFGFAFFMSNIFKVAAIRTPLQK